MNYQRHAGDSKIKENKNHLDQNLNKLNFNFKNLNELNWPWKYKNMPEGEWI